jgi:hypothetical protein
VEKQISDAIAALLAGEEGRRELSKDLAKAAGIGKKKKRKDSPAAGGGDGDGNSDQWARFWELVDRFTWIYPTETAYDHKLGDMVGINPMRLSSAGSMWKCGWRAKSAET